MPDERLKLKQKDMPDICVDMYIVECQSLGGFSGSPAFFEVERITKDKLFTSPEIYLGGVMKGHYNDLVETREGILRELNAGLALVTPCYLLKEILYGDIAQRQVRNILNGES